MVFSSKWWRHTRKTTKAKGVFGGKILSNEEINKLSERIETHEEAEFQQFEKEFDQKLNSL